MNERECYGTPCLFKAGGNMEQTNKEAIRINKYLSDAGVCSRREADRLVEAGRVMVDGVTAPMGAKVVPGQKICIDGKPIEQEEEEILLAFYKPRGIVCTTSKKDKDNIVDYINYGKRIYPIGRLDKDSEGLILLTNKGEWVDAILRGSNYHEKEYIVHVNKVITEDFVKKMAEGMYLEEIERDTRPCKVIKLDERTFKIILTQGFNRQIRRMCDTLGYKVTRLKRIRVMNIKLGSLKVGSYREVSEEEKEVLLSYLK